MANSKHPIFRNTNFVLDGDARENHKNKKTPKTAILPGKFKPEKVFYDFILGLDDNDEFWNKKENFTHQTCFGNHSDKNHKKWFSDKTNQRFFGRGNSHLFNRWKKSHQLEVKNFIDELRVIIS